jgi:hypothetical protein
MAIRHKVLKKHKKDCRAVFHAAEGTWSTPWALTDGFEWRAIDGRKRRGGHHRWGRVICNDPSCKALVIYLERDVLEILVGGHR